MAVLFVRANTQRLEVDSAPVVAAPFTVSCWARSNDDTVDASVIALGDASSGSNRFWLKLDGSGGGNNLAWVLQSAAGFSVSTTSTTFTANQWHHCAAVEASSTDHAAFLDGGGKGTDSNDRTPTGIDRLAIGRTAGSSSSDYMSGDIAEVAIWNVALTDVEVAILAAGYSPLFVRPGSLVSYDPMIRLDANDDSHDIVGGLTLVGAGGTGVPVASNHPRIIYPSELYVPPFLTAAPSGLSIPIAAHHYRQMQGVN